MLLLLLLLLCFTHLAIKFISIHSTWHWCNIITHIYKQKQHIQTPGTQSNNSPLQHIFSFSHFLGDFLRWYIVSKHRLSHKSSSICFFSFCHPLWNLYVSSHGTMGLNLLLRHISEQWCIASASENARIKIQCKQNANRIHRIFHSYIWWDFMKKYVSYIV